MIFALVLAVASLLLLISDLWSGRIHYTRKYKNYYYAWTGKIKINRGSKSYSIWRRRMPIRYWASLGLTALNTFGLLLIYIFYNRISAWDFGEWYMIPFILKGIIYVSNGLFGRLSLWNRRRWREANAPTESQVQTLGLSAPPLDRLPFPTRRTS